MKRIVLVMIAAVIAGAAMAQTEGLGIQLGFTEPILRLNTPTAKEATQLGDKTVMNGFKLGLLYDATIIKGFGSTLGLNYSLAGSHTKWANEGTVGAYPKMQTQTLYQQLELFVDWQYKFEIAKETYLMLYSGPTIQLGLQMNQTTRTQYIDHITESAALKRYDTHEQPVVTDLNRLNITWGIGAGFQYKRYFLRGGYDFGLMNPYKMRNFNEAGLGDRHTRGRLDQWSLKLGIYLWQAGK